MIKQGHVLNRLKELESESVDCCVTSPPYWGLRAYKTEPQIWDGLEGCEHEWVIKKDKLHSGRGDAQRSGKYSLQEPVQDTPISSQFCIYCNAWRGELGLEPIPQLYISHLMQVFTEVKRVMKKSGTLWVNIDDSYSTTMGTTSYSGIDSHGSEELRHINKNRDYGVPAKSLCGIPERFVLAMQDLGFIRRNTIIWHKPSCMPESVKDRFTTDKKYQIIYADPPWKYGCWYQSEKVKRNAADHYRVMSTNDICQLSVNNLTADNCALFMWVTMPCLPDALTIINSWGFRYATCGFVWVKQNKNNIGLFVGLGNYTRANAELCLLGMKGSIPRTSHDIHQIIMTPIMSHSRKPDEIVRDRITGLFGDLPRIELFARRQVEGWDCWGNECTG